MSADGMLKVALDCAMRGWFVFPCRANKQPMTKHGFLDATTDADQITEWWTAGPTALVGVATGASSLVVADVDTGKGDVDGYDTWHDLTGPAPELEDTALVKTPSGGQHAYYRANGHKVANSVGRLGPGIDVRAEGGYVIAAGSPGYEYVPGHGPETVADLPAVLAEKLSYKRTQLPVIPEAVLAIPEGSRNGTLTSRGGTMRRTGMSEDAIEAALLAENKAHCKPPLPGDEVRTIARSVARYEPETAAAPQTGESAPDEPPAIASSPDILSDFNMVLHGCGVVGEDRFGKVVYLCLTSRVLERPVSLAAKGQSSAGKSFVVQEVLKFFPASAYYAMTGMSERVLAYSKEPLQHRFLIVYEAAGMEGDFASYLIRSLLSEGCIRYETMLRVKGKGIVPVLITREGPTGLITTTTKVHLHPENETRLLSVPANDTQEQTAAVMRMLACETGAVCDDNLTEWHALQSWIAAQDNQVTIPYAYQLADLVPPVAVRLRRDFSTVRDLVKAHAILHQQTRERDEQGRIIATLQDYAVVRDLIADLVADEVGATVPPLVVETVNAVSELKATHAVGVTYTQLGAYLKVDKSTAMRRARVATDRGYLQNLEDKRGRPALLTTADALPSDVDILPTVETLSGCVVAYALNPDREKC